jgi:transposase-like protein
MNLSQLTSADLKVIAQLLKEKEALLAQVAKIDARLSSFESAPAPAPAKPARSKPGRRPGRPALKAPPSAAPAAPAKPAAAEAVPARRRRPGKLKEKVIALLQGAGKSGITVREIAAKLGLKPQRIYVWFNATGRTIREIKKVAPATYAWNA